MFNILLLLPLFLAGSHCQIDNLSWSTSGSVGGFLTLEEATELLKNLVETYPHLISEQIIGKSVEGRDIVSYRVSAYDDPSKEPPRLLLTSLMHAREPITLSATVFIVSELLHEFDQHVTDVEFLLKTRELYVIPIVNPDGYSRLTSSGGSRKNARKTCASNPEEGGVDLNRNFAFDWKPVANGCSEEYSGTHAFSEPETQAIRDISIAKKFSSAVHFHAYGNILTIPYNGGEGEKVVREDHLRFYEDIQAAWKFDTFGPSPKTLNYSTNGESDDWFYDQLGVLSLSPELGPESDGFRPGIERVKEVLLNMYPKIKLWMMRAGGPEIDSVRIQSDETSNWVVEFENRGLRPLGQATIVVKDAGSCTSCHGVERCNLALDGRARVFVRDHQDTDVADGWEKMVLPRCDSNTNNLRAEFVVVCFVLSALNCRCFRSLLDGSVISFDRHLISNYLANTEMCESAGISTFSEELSPYGSDSSNWFGFCANILLLVLIVLGLVRILRGVLIPPSSVEGQESSKGVENPVLEEQVE